MSAKNKPHPGLSYRQQSALAKELGIKFADVPEAMKDWEALDTMNLLDCSVDVDETMKTI